MEVGCFKGGPLGSQVREFSALGRGRPKTRHVRDAQGKGGWKPMSGGADVSRTWWSMSEDEGGAGVMTG